MISAEFLAKIAYLLAMVATARGEPGPGLQRAPARPPIETQPEATLAIFYLPRIARSDFAAIRRLIEPCPAEDFAAWLEFQAQEIAAIRASGHAVKLVDVGLEEFARHCARCSGRCDIERLRAYVFEKATGKPY
jgi:hypothetical protein